MSHRPPQAWRWRRGLMGGLANLVAVAALAQPPSAAVQLREIDRGESAGTRPLPKLVRYKQIQILKANGQVVAETHSVVYADLFTPRHRLETSNIADSGVVVLTTSVQDLSRRRSLLLNSQSKIATLTTISDNNAKPFLDWVSDVRSNANTVSQRVTFEGRDTERLRLDDPPRTWTTLWIDRTSKLPVRVETDLTNPSQDATVNRLVFADFEWDPKVTAADSLFETVAPEGYVTEDRTPAHAYPKDLAALRQIESRVIEVAARAVPAVVQVNAGTGVIIDAQGLILSQAHVTHAGDADKPGKRVEIVLQDGRIRTARLLGADRFHDLSLLRLEAPGPYPFTPLADSVDVALGDPVLKIGNPASIRHPGRGPVVRLGRIVCSDPRSTKDYGVFVADCCIDGGDSGGPAYDLQGRLIGILRCTALTEVVRHPSPPSAARPATPHAYTTSRLVRKRLPAMLKGDIHPPDTLANQHTIASLGQAPRLPPDCWTHGTASTSPFREVVKNARRSTVIIRNGDGDAVSLGVIVAANGWVVTKANTLPRFPTCLLPDGRGLPATVIGVRRDFDVALLNVAAAGLEPVTWGDGARLPVGTFIAVPGSQPLATGILSVARRDASSPTRTIIEHDAMLSAQEGGGVIVDLSGVATAFNVSRTTYGCTAIPAEVMQRLICQLAAGENGPPRDQISVEPVPDMPDLLQIPYSDFDQKPSSGWRALAEDKRYLDAARTIERYLSGNPALDVRQRANLHFHAAQCLAFDGQTASVEQALAHLTKARVDPEPADLPLRWNDYVLATSAFLKKDLAALKAARERIAAGPAWNGEVPNLDVVDRLIARFGKSYAEAYGP